MKKERRRITSTSLVQTKTLVMAWASIEINVVKSLTLDLTSTQIWTLSKVQEAFNCLNSKSFIRSA